MQYLDITNSPEKFDSNLLKRLGFKRALNVGEDLQILDSINHNQKLPFLVNASSKASLYSLAKEAKALGILVNGEDLDQKLVSKIKDAGKAIVINAYYLTLGQRDRISKIHRYKKIFRMACKAKAKIVLVSLAPNENYLLSFMQLLEIAKLITNDDHQAKKMVTSLGEITNDT